MGMPGAGTVLFQKKWAALAVAGLLAAAPAQADEFDWINFIVGAQVQYDDNLYRLSSGTDPATVLGRGSKSSTISTVNAGVKIDQPVGLQRFQLDAMVKDNRYSGARYLDWTGLDYRAAWLWQVTPKVGGVLSSDRVQSLASFADYRNYNTRNIQTVQNHRANVDWWVEGAWHLLAGVLHTEARNTASFTAVGDFDQTTFEGGVRYVTREENSLTVSVREARGRYQDRPLDPATVLDNGFKQHEVEARAVWRVSAQSLLDGRLGYLQRKHDNYAQRDFDGPVGRLDYQWTPTAKLRFDFTLARNLYSFQEIGNSYYVANSFSFSPVWLITEKTNARLRFDEIRRDFRGAVVAGAAQREETLRNAALIGEWKPLRSLTVIGELRREQRHSNLAGYDYRANIVGVKAQLMF